MSLAKGSTLQSTLEFVRQRAGDAAVEAVSGRLGSADRAAVARAQPTDEVPFALLLRLWEAVDAVLGAEDPTWIEESGAFSIGSVGAQLYGGILRKSSPVQFLTQSVSLFQLYYQPGDMEVVEHADDRAVLRLVGFDHGTRFFCRRQTGGLTRALTLAGGSAPRVRHVRCTLDGDAFCEWELRWSVSPAS